MNKGLKSFFEFTLAPLLIFSVALLMFLFFSWLFSKESNTEKLLGELQSSTSRKKWQIAYDLAINKKHLSFIKDNTNAHKIISTTLKETLAQYSNAPINDKDDTGKFIEYMIYLLSYCNNNDVNDFFKENLLTKDNSFLDIAILAIANTKRVELTSTILDLYQQVSPDIQIRILFVLGILPQTEQSKQVLLKEFYSVNNLKKLNSAFALARSQEKIVLSYFQHLLENENYKQLEINDKNGTRKINEEEEISILSNILKSIRFFAPEQLHNFTELISKLETKTKHFTIRRLCKELIFWINKSDRK